MSDSDLRSDSNRSFTDLESPVSDPSVNFVDLDLRIRIPIFGHTGIPDHMRIARSDGLDRILDPTSIL